MSNELAGRRAIVTGGASGIGRTTVELFVREGAQVLIADVADQAGQDLARGLGAAAAYCHTDVSKAEQVEALVAQAIELFGGLDIMYNNAGISEPMSKVDLIDEEFTQFSKVLAVDLLGPMLGIKFAARAMRAQGRGSIINTASTGGFFAGRGMPVYRTAKAGVIALTQMAAIELGGLGIRVNCISPGPIETPMAGAGFPPEIAAKLAAATSRLLTDMQVLKRVGQPIDIANAAVFLASERSAHITGQNLVVDGGVTAGDKVDRIALIQTEMQAILGPAKSY